MKKLFIQKKKNQHYVWQHYLKPWTKNDKLYCLRDKKIFNPKLNRVGVMRNFYRLKRLSTNDINFLKHFINNSPKHLQPLQHDYLILFNSIFRMIDLLDLNGYNDNNYLKEIDIAINNLAEDFHTKIEQDSISHLHSLLNKNTNFVNLDEEYLTFLIFLCTQYFRTKKMKSNIVSTIKDTNSININNIWNVLSHMFALNIANYLFIHKDEFKLTLFENDTFNSLITGDQPVINILAKASHTNTSTPVTDMEIYYPISPKLAILISHNDKYVK